MVDLRDYGEILYSDLGEQGDEIKNEMREKCGLHTESRTELKATDTRHPSWRCHCGPEVP